MTTLITQQAGSIGEDPLDLNTRKTSTIPAMAPCGLQSIATDNAANYYDNTMSPAGTELPAVTNAPNVQVQMTSSEMIEVRFNNLSVDIDGRLKCGNYDFDALQRMIFHVIMLQMRKGAKTDQETIFELTLQISKANTDIKGTYNTWGGITVTLITAGISVIGGFAGLVPMVQPMLTVSAKTGEILKGFAQAATPLTSVGQSLGSVGSIFKEKHEADRGSLQHRLKRLETKEEDRKSAKHSSKDTQKTTQAALKEFDRTKNEVTRTMTGG